MPDNDSKFSLCPYFQPIISIVQKSIVGHEVLARGLTPKGTLLTPPQIFKKENSIWNIKIDRKIREKAFKIFSSGTTNGLLFLNVHPEYFLKIRNITANSNILRLCNKYGMNPRQVVIELTESAVASFEDVASILQGYKKLGFHIAVDDWGTGHSNFDRISLIQPSILKVDRELLWKAASNMATAEAFKTAVSMATRLGINVIAEGVENEEQFHLAIEAGCTMVQGFLWAKPGPELLEGNALSNKLSKALAKYSSKRIRQIVARKKWLQECIEKIHDMLDCRQKEKELCKALRHAVKELHNQTPSAVRGYLLKSSTGVQISPDLIKTKDGIRENRSKVGFDWSWRPYYLDFKANEQLFGAAFSATGPYLDHEIGKLLYTLTVAKRDCIICIDFVMD